jgi:hypothetical protein
LREGIWKSIIRNQGGGKGVIGGPGGIKVGIGLEESSLGRGATIGIRVAEILVRVNRIYNSPRSMTARRLPEITTTIVLMLRIPPRAIFAGSTNPWGLTVTQKKQNKRLLHGKGVMSI